MWLCLEQATLYSGLMWGWNLCDSTILKCFVLIHSFLTFSFFFFFNKLMSNLEEKGLIFNEGED